MSDTNRNIDYINSLKWPILIAVFILWQHQTIDKIFKYIPTLVEQSSKITIGNVSFEISERLSDKVNTEMKSALAGLSNGAILRLIDTGNEIHRINLNLDENLIEIEEAKELSSRKLATFTETAPDEHNNTFEYKLTELGLKANKLVKEALLEQFKLQH